MRIALLSDVHGNWQALEIVLTHARRQRVDQFLGVGDWIGGADAPNEVLHWLATSGALAIAGNYDLAVLEVPEKRKGWTGGEPPSRWRLAVLTYDHLTEESKERITRLPTSLRLNLVGRRILVVHSSPGSEEEDLLSDTPSQRFRELAHQADADVVILGHTHAPLALKSGRVWFVNPGSVGRPRDGKPFADYAILTLGQRRVQVRHYRLPFVGQAAQRAPEADETADADSPATTTPEKGRRDPNELKTAVLELARSCEYEEQHTLQVTRLALRLFDELQMVHGLGPSERFWLECAALLHDIGLIEGVEGHHKASLRIILESPLLTFGKTERLLIGSIARYHRAALPSERHRHFARLKPAARRTVRMLAALLRVADGLDYTHQSVVHDLVCVPVLSPEALLIRCSVEQQAEAEKNRALEKGDLLTQVLERTLAVECELS